MKFSSNARFNQEINQGTIFRLKDNNLNIVIHKIKGYGDEWYLSCSMLNVNDYKLNTCEFREAVANAKVVILSKLLDITNMCNAFINDDVVDIGY